MPAMEAPQFWLMKSEPADCSVDDAWRAPDRTVAWAGVRNYQARNFMRDRMCVDDGVLFCHSGGTEPGIVGIARVASASRPDPTQFDPASPWHDPDATLAAPRWVLVDVQLLRKTRTLTLRAMRTDPRLAGMRVLARGNRLSITPVAAEHWGVVQALLD